MISINLVPEKKRRKKKRNAFLGGGLSLPREAVVGLVGGIVALLLFIHIVLQLLITVKFVQHKKYEEEMKKIGVQKENSDLVLQKLKAKQAQYREIEAIATRSKILLSQKLNAISDSIPRGVWLNRISFDKDALLIEGSAVSKTATEMISVHDFTAKLKEKQGFAESFLNLELGLIKRRKVNTTPLADFTIKADLTKE